MIKKRRGLKGELSTNDPKSANNHFIQRPKKTKQLNVIF